MKPSTSVSRRETPASKNITSYINLTISSSRWKRLSIPRNRLSFSGNGNNSHKNNNSPTPDEDLSTDPERLTSICSSICSEMLKSLDYTNAPKVSREEVMELLDYMHKRALEIGVPLNTPLSEKGFRLGYGLGLLAHPNHSVEAKGYVGLITWLVVQYDDIVGQGNKMVDEGLLFQQRFFQGKPQANKLLEGIATLLREAYTLYDPVLTNMVQISVLKFLTSNLLERHNGFQNLEVTSSGVKFPYFYRDMSGMDVAYAVFCYPKDQYPDVGAFLEAIPDMAVFINISNDILSFYKEELSGDNRNYLHNLAKATGRPMSTVLEDVKQDSIDSADRAAKILRGRGIYEQSWLESVQGYVAMHTTHPRYRLKDLGLGQEHPLTPYEGEISKIFE